MNLLKRIKTPVKLAKSETKPASKPVGNQAAMAEMALKVIHDGVIITDKNGVIEFINPAAANMTGYSSPNQVLKLDYGLVLKIESKEGRTLSDAENPLIQAMKTNQPLDPFQCTLIVGQSDKRIPVAISVLPSEGLSSERIITFRDITKELEEEGEQTEFISTASHEMRTPVATIDGYLSLALNPQTATVDERAQGYLTAAQKASKHLGKLFQDLLDVTKLDDGHIRPHFEPAEMIDLVKTISDDYLSRAKTAKVHFSFGSDQPQVLGDPHSLPQRVYSSIDMSFMREVMDNLIDNALKYTPAGGSIYVNVRGDGDRVLINVTDTGMGISSDDLGHIFQKFYRADNSDTRTVGGTGLGLYLVKQRVEAMGGRVWAESAFGEGSTFFVSLPRISQEEYDKRMIAVTNQKAEEQARATAAAATQVAAPTPAPVSAPAPQVPQAPQSTPTPVATPAPQSAPTTPTPVAPPVTQAVPAQTAPTPAQAAMSTPQPIAPVVRPTTPAPPPNTLPTPPAVVKTSQQIDINLKGGTNE